MVRIDALLPSQPTPSLTNCLRLTAAGVCLLPFRPVLLAGCSDNTKLGSGCVHGDSKSLLLPPGAHVKTYSQCNIIWAYPAAELVVLEEHSNPSSDWLCVELNTAFGSLYIIELGTIGGWGGTFLLVFMLGLLGYIGGFAAMTHRRLGGQVDWRSEWLPHRTFWLELGGMVTDGVRFSRARLEAKIKGEVPAPTLREGLLAGAERKAEGEGADGREQHEGQAEVAAVAAEGDVQGEGQEEEEEGGAIAAVDGSLEAAEASES